MTGTIVVRWAKLTTVPGEPIIEVGRDIKARAAAKGFAHALVIGRAGDHRRHQRSRH